MALTGRDTISPRQTQHNQKARVESVFQSSKEGRRKKGGKKKKKKKKKGKKRKERGNSAEPYLLQSA
jgi:hypothetical protein